jgi:hypothetical protein
LIDELEPKTCTTSGRPVDIVRAEQTEKTGQHKDYIVLCPDERAKGFIRPFRNKYIHVGRFNSHWKGVHRILWGNEISPSPSGEPYVAVMTILTNEDGSFKGGAYVTKKELDAWQKGERIGGCGVETRMGDALSETYARDPKFYGATFCVGCNQHLPAGEFIWSQDGEIVGS